MRFGQKQRLDLDFTAAGLESYELDFRKIRKQNI